MFQIFKAGKVETTRQTLTGVINVLTELTDGIIVVMDPEGYVIYSAFHYAQGCVISYGFTITGWALYQPELTRILNQQVNG